MLVGAWINRRDVVVGARRSEKLREHQYRKDMLGLLRGRGRIIMLSICGSR